MPLEIDGEPGLGAGPAGAAGPRWSSSRTSDGRAAQPSFQVRDPSQGRPRRRNGNAVSVRQVPQHNIRAVGFERSGEQAPIRVRDDSELEVMEYLPPGDVGPVIVDARTLFPGIIHPCQHLVRCRGRGVDPGQLPPQQFSVTRSAGNRSGRGASATMARSTRTRARRCWRCRRPRGRVEASGTRRMLPGEESGHQPQQGQPQGHRHRPDVRRVGTARNPRDLSLPEAGDGGITLRGTVPPEPRRARASANQIAYTTQLRTRP